MEVSTSQNRSFHRARALSGLSGPLSSPRCFCVFSLRAFLHKGSLKHLPRSYQPCGAPASGLVLAKERRLQQIGALKVALVWIAANAVVGLLYIRRVIGVAELLLLCLLYFVSDLVCVLLYSRFAPC